MTIRQKNWNNLNNKDFDVAIIGGGINGASTYKRLCEKGYKVFLIDKGDFSCGTSQASAMMIWGGLLYLKNLDFLSVYNLSKDRDVLIDSFSDQITSQTFRYIPNKEWGRNKYFVYLCLQFYWMLGKFNRDRPSFQNRFEESEFIQTGNDADSLIYQEGFLKQSDSRFVLDWILNNQTEDSMAMNYCSLLNGSYNKNDKKWYLDIKDSFSNNECQINARIILNCAGVWTDTVNSQFGIQSPYKHVFSKGVFIGYQRPECHKLPLIFEMGENGDTLTFIPWGPVSLWGPTETMESSIENGYSITSDDIHFLQKHANRNLKSSLAKSNIISLRCGLRPLAVPTSFTAGCYPLDISRHYKIIEDTTLPWFSIYGGKISGCLSMAENAVKRIARKLPPESSKRQQAKQTADKPLTTFPGLNEKFPTIDWCVNNEFCCTLEDYLRRRTNISQWTPREGLGIDDSNIEHLKLLASRLPEGEGENREKCLNEYKETVYRKFDTLMQQI